MKDLGKCQIAGCKKPAKFALYKTYAESRKVWVHVCDAHDKEIGAENETRNRLAGVNGGILVTD